MLSEGLRELPLSRYWVQIKETPNKSQAFCCRGELRLGTFSLYMTTILANMLHPRP
ncbi:MAG: hypothetical protein ACK5N2_03885 [bacterium]|uniref:hypothetical protein n=1 Tax=Microcystis aeruginosa TaxID=1126 RepID=UPI0023308C32|nr:hypothetical protein [Microcystis aeruginosa]MDB9393440.1 hypothetical protein [Microcystis aeruginosa CS-579]